MGVKTKLPFPLGVSLQHCAALMASTGSLFDSDVGGGTARRALSVDVSLAHMVLDHVEVTQTHWLFASLQTLQLLTHGTVSNS